MVELNSITIYETIIFFLFNFIILLIGFILWYVLWIRKYGIEIPEIINNTQTYFSSRNLALVLEKLYSLIKDFDKIFIIKSMGYEAYVFFLFQKKIITLFISYLIVFIVFYIINNYGYFIYSNKENLLIFTNIFSILIVTFLHFRSFNLIKKEAYNLYFSRFDKMSQNYDVNWLSSRTLHISGIESNERNTSILQTKLNYFLSRTNSGKVIDINFIPNYNKLIKYEIQKNEINDLKIVITKEKPFMRCLFSSIYWSDDAMNAELEKIERKIQEITEEPVYSSGHAFICFDSLKAAYNIITEFKESSFKQCKVKLKSMFQNCKKCFKNENLGNDIFGQKGSSTFQRFNEELQIDDLEANNLNEDILIYKNVDILVDQMIEPIDIIWKNVGGDRGLFIVRRIILNILLLLLLIFFTTPMSLFSFMKKFDTFKVLEFNWVIQIPYGYIIITYIVPLIILTINLGLIVLIDIICRLEKHYTHTNYHYAVFSKSYIYMLFNLLIIPSLTISYEPLYQIISSGYKNLLQLISHLSGVYEKYYFFITLIVQNGTISFTYYLLRLDELIFNAFSTQVTFYIRHFINTGHYWHRDETYCFLYGYFYAQYMVFYTICLVFSNSNGFLLLAGIYLFGLRHIGDYISLISVHGLEIDSNGKLINHILNYNFVPLLIYQIFAITKCLYEKNYYSSIFIGVIIFISLIYYFIEFDNEYLVDIYTLNRELSNYEQNKGAISHNEINKWRNKYGHPLVIPVFVENSQRNDE